MMGFLLELFGFVDYIWDLPILNGLSVGKMMFGFVVISLVVWVMGLSFKDDVSSSIRQSHRDRDRAQAKRDRAKAKREEQEGSNQ